MMMMLGLQKTLGLHWLPNVVCVHARALAHTCAHEWSHTHHAHTSARTRTTCPRTQMTTPVVTQVRLTEDDEFKDDYTVSLFLPLE